MREAYGERPAPGPSVGTVAIMNFGLRLPDGGMK
jgi:hypothetical protein